MDVAVDYFNSLPSTKTLLKTYKLSANPSVFNRLKIWNAGTSNGTFWNNKYEIKGIPFFYLPALAVTLAGPVDKYGTYMSSVMKTKRKKQNKKHAHSCAVFFYESENQLVIHLPRILS